MNRQLLLNWTGAVLLILMLVISGCSKNNNDSSPVNNQEQPADGQESNQTQEEKSDDGESNSKEQEKTATRTIEHMEGTIEIPDQPKRIVDISGMTEDLLILDIQPLGTANTDPFDNSLIDPLIKEKLNPSAIPLGYYGGGTINLEAIISLEPDLILTNIRHHAINDKLAQIAPTVIVKDNEYSTDWRGRFVHLGEIFNRQDDVSTWLDGYDQKAKRLHDEIVARTGDETFGIIEVGAYGYRIYADAGVGDILFNDMKLNRVPGTPEGEWGASISLEGLTTIDPDHIILLYSDTELQELEASSIWKNMTAVKRGQVYRITNEVQYAQAFTTLGKSNLIDTISQLVLNKK